VWYRGEATVLVFNHEHMVWDDDSGDDYKCDIGAVSHWMPLPAPPTAENVEGANLNHTTPPACNAAYPGTGPVVIGGTAGVA
jgi:hypothetical protein